MSTSERTKLLSAATLLAMVVAVAATSRYSSWSIDAGFPTGGSGWTSLHHQQAATWHQPSNPVQLLSMASAGTQDAVEPAGPLADSEDRLPVSDMQIAAAALARMPQQGPTAEAVSLPAGQEEDAAGVHWQQIPELHKVEIVVAGPVDAAFAARDVSSEITALLDMVESSFMVKDTDSQEAVPLHQYTEQQVEDTDSQQAVLQPQYMEQNVARYGDRYGYYDYDWEPARQQQQQQYEYEQEQAAGAEERYDSSHEYDGHYDIIAEDDKWGQAKELDVAQQHSESNRDGYLVGTLMKIAVLGTGEGAQGPRSMPMTGINESDQTQMWPFSGSSTTGGVLETLTTTGTLDSSTVGAVQSEITAVQAETAANAGSPCEDMPMEPSYAWGAQPMASMGPSRRLSAATSPQADDQSSSHSSNTKPEVDATTSAATNPQTMTGQQQAGLPALPGLPPLPAIPNGASVNTRMFKYKKQDDGSSSIVVGTRFFPLVSITTKDAPGGGPGDTNIKVGPKGGVYSQASNGSNTDIRVLGSHP